ncbi:MAG: hydantoinase B/oxoprolinase family protein [Planctomycetota bacterium]|jgi:5-oxoprolinase (ATP-hydrolysing)|nr:hydantoinase B/oxoprolinase family protein [Planctomycetota bacterium]
MNWRIWVDTGGTFTDAIAVNAAGTMRRCKVLSSSCIRATVRAGTGTLLECETSQPVPAAVLRGATCQHGALSARVLDHGRNGTALHLDRELPCHPGDTLSLTLPVEPPVLACHLLTETPGDAPLPSIDLRIATTRGTNALLERAGADFAFFVTAGFEDLLTIGDQTRTDLFARTVTKAPVLPRLTIGVTGRLNADGSEHQALDLATLRQHAQAAYDQGIRSAAIALLHAYRNPQHEQAVASCLADIGFTTIACSAALSPHIKLLARGQTACVDAYLAPILDSYLDGVQAHCARGNLSIMTSAGGVIERAGYHAKDSLLSGPAGGVAGAAEAGQRSGENAIIGFDMGGTSTDVCRWAGGFDYCFSHRVGDAQLQAPALAIHTVAAGGGSVCGVHDGRLFVGPASAGAAPGPACYGADGPLTITDCNLVLGRIDSTRLPVPVDETAALNALKAAHRQLDDAPALLDLAEGFLSIANQRMADAICSISLARGANPAQHALVAFGGAGPQNACAVAEALDMSCVLVPPDAGLLSARGLGGAERERFASRQVLAPLSTIDLPELCAELDCEALELLEATGPARIRERHAACRLQGQEATIDCPVSADAATLERCFAQQYQETFGHAPDPARSIELEALRVIAAESGDALPDIDIPAGGGASSLGTATGHFAGRSHQVPRFERATLGADDCIAGPALIVEDHSASVVPPNWQVQLDQAGALRITRAQRSATRQASAVIERELFANRFTGIAEAMGAQLAHTAVSTNVKERLDFSCALLDPQGRLVVNAPHIPVHLGALGLCVRAVAAALTMQAGDVVVTNHPGFGGSHLPDVTVISPIFSPDNTLLGYAANRAHHAEIGGIRPGSMPPDARNLCEEGVVIEPCYLVKSGVACWDEITQRLATAPHPSRKVADNLADLRAALAANQRGVVSVQALAAEHGSAHVLSMMDTVQSHARERARLALRQLGTDTRHTCEYLDQGAAIKVTLSWDHDQPHLDFTGSAPVQSDNHNATPAIVTAAVLYALRLLIDEPIPLNEGILDGVRVTIPPGMLNPHFPDEPTDCPPVVAGNTEVSQRIVDALLALFGIAACSQGTMNNLLFGSADFGYYETIAGGTGATAHGPGCSGVHSHMTNTRITDPEILEHRYPVRLERFALRPDSGGNGHHRGGDGVIRQLHFTEAVSVSLLSQHRTSGPYGYAGGQPGQPGAQWILRRDGTREPIAGISSIDLAAGEGIVIASPGGGGWG